MVRELSRNTYSDLAAGEPAAHRKLSDAAFLAALVTFERELAHAAAEAGLIVTAEAEQGIRTIDGVELDLDTLSRESVAGANPAIPLVTALRAVDPTGIHVGATSQDAIDTALMICLRDAVADLLGDVDRLAGDLADLARAHRDTPMIARTLGQQATPTTFGCVAANWWQGIDAARTSLSDLEFPVQYAGASGNLTSAFPHGIAVHEALAARTDLASRPLVWHTDRSPVVRIAAALVQLTGAVSKIAGDIVALSAGEVGEVREPSPGGSSAMPHKANPAASVAARGYALRAPGLAATLFQSMDQRHQRADGAWHAEWQTVRELAAVSASALARLGAAVDGLAVDTGRMAENLAACPTGDQNPGHAAELVDLIVNEPDNERRL
ncbi:lyase family protein [Corynebacterium frankenforstense]|uniref:lyase family protein n=1 Tax=Corynebacterium frankenforstense TaxID=1230998 RepID=UPI00254A0900|nr:lyase family protein [Corynebacterium frankenforstense]MDK6259371.1 lyase family protein [Corynebacterium frankenforstense]